MTTTEMTTINTENYSAMAQMMGISDDNSNKNKKSTNLNRLRLWHSPIMGQEEIKGKLTKVEVIEGGTYRLEILEDDTSKFVYSKDIRVQPFMQRFMYRRYVANINAKEGEPRGSFHRTIMSNTLNQDLKDNTGKFNCGKPTGYVEDFKSLSTEMQDLIRNIKRVRVMFGVVTMINPMDSNGDEIKKEIKTPFIWEIDNKEAFKTVGVPFLEFAKTQRLPIQHDIVFSAPKEHEISNGFKYYTPICSIDSSVNHSISTENEKLFNDFLEWVKNYNDYICKEWDSKAIQRQDEISDEDASVVEDFIEMDIEDK